MRLLCLLVSTVFAAAPVFAATPVFAAAPTSVRDILGNLNDKVKTSVEGSFVGWEIGQPGRRVIYEVGHYQRERQDGEMEDFTPQIFTYGGATDSLILKLDKDRFVYLRLDAQRRLLGWMVYRGDRLKKPKRIVMIEKIGPTTPKEESLRAAAPPFLRY